MRSSRSTLSTERYTVGSDLCVHPCVCAVCAQVGRTTGLGCPSQLYCFVRSRDAEKEAEVRRQSECESNLPESRRVLATKPFTVPRVTSIRVKSCWTKPDLLSLQPCKAKEGPQNGLKEIVVLHPARRFSGTAAVAFDQ